MRLRIVPARCAPDERPSGSTAGCPPYWPAENLAAQPVVKFELIPLIGVPPMFNTALLNRIEMAIQTLRAELRLKEQQDCIEAQQIRIESLLKEAIELLEQRQNSMTPEEQSTAAKNLDKISDTLDSFTKPST